MSVTSINGLADIPKPNVSHIVYGSDVSWVLSPDPPTYSYTQNPKFPSAKKKTKSRVRTYTLQPLPMLNLPLLLYRYEIRIVRKEPSVCLRCNVVMLCSFHILLLGLSNQMR